MTGKSPGPIWSKRVGDEAVASLNVAYCAGRDVRGRPAADLALIDYDLATNAAHALMLAETGIVSAEEGGALLGALLEIRDRREQGESILRTEAEDIHMSIELMVTEIAGAGMGGRLHTGRSRNDQVATDMRLWLRDRVANLAAEVAELIRALTTHASQHVDTAMPGMTHTQPAMITTWGHWVAGYAARMMRDLRHLGNLLDDLRDCPLGAAASFGTSWPVDRERTAVLLGFEAPTANSTDAIWSRGETEAGFVFTAAQLLSHLSGIAQDIVLLSSPPRDWLRLPDGFVTGSSIMPQKRNPDFCEVTRAKAAMLAGYAQALFGIGTSAVNGYNRDTQWTKYLVMDAAEEVRGAPALFAEVFRGVPGISNGIEVHAGAMSDACHEGFLNATDAADYLARTRGLPFRDCYRVLGAAVRACEKSGQLSHEAINAELRQIGSNAAALSAEEMSPLNDPRQLVAMRTQTGSPHPDKVRESLDRIGAEAAQLWQDVDDRARTWQQSLEDLWALVEERVEGL